MAKKQRSRQKIKEQKIERVCSVCGKTDTGLIRVKYHRPSGRGTLIWKHASC